MERVVVVGGPGSGKTTLARRLSAGIDADHVELDALWWGPGWTPATAEQLRARVDRATSAARWVADGNYLDEIADVLWRRADTLVWLDLPRWRCIGRVLARTAGRLLRRRPLWNGNRQSLRDLSPASVSRLIRRWSSYGVRIERRLAAGSHPGLTVVRLRHPADVDRWLASLPTRP